MAVFGHATLPNVRRKLVALMLLRGHFELHPLSCFLQYTYRGEHHWAALSLRCNPDDKGPYRRQLPLPITCNNFSMVCSSSGVEAGVEGCSEKFRVCTNALRWVRGCETTSWVLLLLNRNGNDEQNPRK